MDRQLQIPNLQHEQARNRRLALPHTHLPHHPFHFRKNLPALPRRLAPGTPPHTQRNLATSHEDAKKALLRRRQWPVQALLRRLAAYEYACGPRYAAHYGRARLGLHKRHAGAICV